MVVLGLSLRRSAYLRRINEAGGELRTDSFVESQPSLLDIPTAHLPDKEETS